jgi:hypothetical protein
MGSLSVDDAGGTSVLDRKYKLCCGGTLGRVLSCSIAFHFILGRFSSFFMQGIAVISSRMVWYNRRTYGMVTIYIMFSDFLKGQIGSNLT